MTLRVFDDRRGRIKSHRLIVEQRGGEGGQVVALQIGAGIGDEREAGGVRFGKSVEREGSDGENDFFLRFRRDAVVRHAGAQLGFDFAHARLRALEAHGAAQFFRLASGEVGGDHRHAQQLFLKERDAERALEHGFERWVRIGDVFASLAALQKRIHHLADDRARDG